MITLTSDYQYIGRSNGVSASGGDYSYFILIYAKTKADQAAGKHEITVKMRLACSATHSFYDWRTSAAVTVAGSAAFAWDSKLIPGSAWGTSGKITAGGVEYPRWVDLAEGTGEVSTNYEALEVDISAYWQRLPISGTAPDYLPDTTEAKAAFTVLLPEIEKPSEDEPAEPSTAVYHGVRAYADGVLAYDSRLEEYDLNALKVATGENIGGTAELAMPLGHPAYHFFVNYRTIVTIYRDGRLRFRGRALYPTDNYNGQRTITCEGELCFLRDGVSRPHLYQDTPANIFTALIEDYNSQVEPFKRFTVGTITVLDNNDYVRLEIENAEQILDTVNKLLERCGGYITFTSATDGSRVINWYAELNRKSNQTIEFGENLLDFASTGGTTDAPATALVPYGAKDETTGQRVTIESVNGGKDYIVATDAQAVRGTITATATWDDVTKPENLLTKAEAYLADCKLLVTSLELTALDLSHLDKTLDLFTVGDMIRVVSKPHGVDEDFLLSTMTEDLLYPEESSITLGKRISSLTGADAAGDNKGMQAIEETRVQIKTDYDAAIKQATEEIQKTVSSEISQTASEILLEVAATYTTQTHHKALSSRVETLAGSITLEVSGGLGNMAAIRLTVDGQPQTYSIDMSAVRKAFADDTSAVTISGGSVTFNSGTFIVNSGNLQVDKNGNLTARNANLSGTLTTESGLHMSKLNSGRLFFYYDGVEYGGIASTYWVDAPEQRGVEVRVENTASFLSFGRDNDADGTYTPAYIINYGMNPSDLTERHLFYGNARFINGSAYFAKAAYFETNAIFANTYGARFKVKDGSTTALGMYMSAENQLVMGADEYPTYVIGSNLHLGKADMPTTIYGNSISIKNRARFSTIAYFDSNAVFANTFGTRFYLKDGETSVLGLYMSAANELLLGDSAYPTYIRASALYLGQSAYPTVIQGGDITVKNKAIFEVAASFNSNAVFDNGYGLRLRLKGNASSALVLYMNDGDTVRLGHSSYAIYMYGNDINLQNATYINATAYCKYNLYIANQYCLRTYTADGSYGAEAVWMSSDNYMYIGDLSYPTYVRGSTLHLGKADVNTKIYGAWIYLNSKVYCNAIPITFSNGYGVKCRDKSGDDHYVLSMDSSNNVGVGATDYPLYLRGTAVKLNSSGATVTSDRRKKNSIEEIPEAYMEALDKLTPKRFKFNDGNSGRYHVGFIAQEVEEALAAAGLTGADFGGFVDLNGDGTELGLIYTEFVGLLAKKIKRLESQINELKGAKA